MKNRMPMGLVIMAVILFLSQTVHGQADRYVTPISSGGYCDLSPRDLDLIQQLAFGADEGTPKYGKPPANVRRWGKIATVSVVGATAEQLRATKWAIYRFSVLTYPTATFVYEPGDSGDIRIVFGSRLEGSRFLGIPIDPSIEGCTINSNTDGARVGSKIFVASDSGANTVVHELGHAVSFGGDSYQNDGIWSDRADIPKFCSRVEIVSILALYHYSYHLAPSTSYMLSVRRVPIELYDQRVNILKETLAK